MCLPLRYRASFAQFPDIDNPDSDSDPWGAVSVTERLITILQHLAVTEGIYCYCANVSQVLAQIIMGHAYNDEL